MTDGLWETPLGNIRIASEIASVLADEYDFVVETCSRFEEDNTIEVQLPFIKYFFPEARLLPVGLPPTSESLDIARRAGELCLSNGLNVISVGSTDLTHYGPNYGFMPAGFGDNALKWVYHNDERVIKRMCAMDAFGVIEEALSHHNACCPGACASAIAMAEKMGALGGDAADGGRQHWRPADLRAGAVRGGLSPRLRG
jgi:AmmeMemoRadiSam system protein B